MKFFLFWTVFLLVAGMDKKRFPVFICGWMEGAEEMMAKTFPLLAISIFLCWILMDFTVFTRHCLVLESAELIIYKLTILQVVF